MTFFEKVYIPSKNTRVQYVTVIDAVINIIIFKGIGKAKIPTNIKRKIAKTQTTAVPVTHKINFEISKPHFAIKINILNNKGIEKAKILKVIIIAQTITVPVTLKIIFEILGPHFAIKFNILNNKGIEKSEILKVIIITEVDTFKITLKVIKQHFPKNFITASKKLFELGSSFFLISWNVGCVGSLFPFTG